MERKLLNTCHQSTKQSFLPIYQRADTQIDKQTDGTSYQITDTKTKQKVFSALHLTNIGSVRNIWLLFLAVYMTSTFLRSLIKICYLQEITRQLDNWLCYVPQFHLPRGQWVQQPLYMTLTDKATIGNQDATLSNSTNYIIHRCLCIKKLDRTIKNGEKESVLWLNSFKISGHNHENEEH